MLKIKRKLGHGQQVKNKKKEDKEKRWWDAHDGFPRVRRQMVKEVHTTAIATFGKIRQACAIRGAGLRRRTNYGVVRKKAENAVS